MIRTIDDETHTIKTDYESVEEFADACMKWQKAYFRAASNEEALGKNLPHRPGYSGFHGSSCRTPRDVRNMARDGWNTHLNAAIELAQNTVETVEKEVECLSFDPLWDVSGSVVDVGQYLAGEPECMIEIPPMPSTKNGRVVSLCASFSYSCAIKEATMVKRGKVICALALELSRLGIGLELYADFSGTDSGIAANANGEWVKFTHRQRVLVKSCNDTLDPAKILFAFANPNMLRTLGMANMHGYPAPYKDGCGVGNGYSTPREPIRDLPEGTIYLPCLRSGEDIPDADVLLRQYLTELGLVEE